MTITFHCDYCGKKIDAADSAGGKWGKCPACHNKLYVPSPETDEEELKLAPIDESEEERKKRLMDETYRLTQDILKEKQVPPDGVVELPAEPEGQSGLVARLAPEMSDKELTKNIILYLRQMADGELEPAEVTADLIAPYGRQALKILDGIGLSEIPEPELADVPQQVLAGLIRNLRTRIS